MAIFLSHKTTVLALSLYLFKHCLVCPSSSVKLLSGFSSRCHFNVSPSFAILNHRNGSRRAKFSAVATEVTEKPTAAPPPGEDGDCDVSEGRVVLPTNQSSEKLLRIRHTCAHVMAMAVQKIYPDVKVPIGPWIDMEPLTDKDLKKIKKEMDRIIGRSLPLIREEVSRDEAQKRIIAVNEPYRMEILDSIKEEPITNAPSII